MDPLDALRANPFDDELRLVVADQLQRAGDPQGELAIVQHRLRVAPTPELRAREAALVAQLITGADVQALAVADRDQILGVTWRLGWIDRARVQMTGWPEREHRIAGVVDWLATARPALLVEHLELAIGSWKRDVIFEELLGRLVAGGPYPALRTLSVGGFVDFAHGHEARVGRDLSAVYITNRYLSEEEAVVGALTRRCPRLEEVRLQGNVAQLGALALPCARVFELCTSSLGRAALSDLSRATWPALERLVLWFGDCEYGYGDPCNPDEVARFVRGLEGACPALRHLALANSPRADEMLEALEASPPESLLARLTTFDVSLGTLGPAGAATLVELAPRFTSLATLDVTRNYLGIEQVARLRDAYLGCEVLGAGQQVPALVADRYPAVGE